jgi:hypothetical protein
LGRGSLVDQPRELLPDVVDLVFRYGHVAYGLIVAQTESVVISFYIFPVRGSQYSKNEAIVVEV